MSVDDFTGGASMTVQKVSDLDGARETFARNVVIRLAAERVGNGLLDEIRDVVRVHQHGQTLLCIDYARPGASVRLPLGDDWRVHPTQELLRSLAEIVGPESIDVEY